MAQVAMQPSAMAARQTHDSSEQEELTPSRKSKPLILSPQITIEILKSTDFVLPLECPADQQEQYLVSCATKASEAERAWGIKAAQAAQQIRSWHDEVASWKWVDKTDQDFGKHGFQQSIEQTKLNDYEFTLKCITEEMSSLDVELLKDHVRQNHNVEGQRNNLDDFTALITATIVQSLPVLSRLNSLRSQWSTRLIILKQVPKFMAELEELNLDISSASNDQTRASLKMKPSSNAKDDASNGQESDIGDRVRDIGKTVDQMLDLLEGSTDCLPEQWIDSVDNLERAFQELSTAPEEPNEDPSKPEPILKGDNTQSDSPGLAGRDGSEINSDSDFTIQEAHSNVDGTFVFPPSHNSNDSPPASGLGEQQSMKTQEVRALPTTHPSSNMVNDKDASQIHIPKMRRQTPKSLDKENIPSGKSHVPQVEVLESRISSILTRIPADIHLDSTTVPRISSTARSHTIGVSRSRIPLAKSALWQRTASRSPQSPTLTLTPAPANKGMSHSKPSVSTNEPAIKVYHLQEAGKNHVTTPIKLHIRLVGTGSGDPRVMVRVGGGWSDLEEYLRDYALHHGSEGARASGKDRKSRNSARPSLDTRFNLERLPTTPSPATHTPRSGSFSGSTRIASGAKHKASPLSESRSTSFSSPVVAAPSSQSRSHSSSQRPPSKRAGSSSPSLLLGPAARPSRQNSANQSHSASLQSTPEAESGSNWIRHLVDQAASNERPGTPRKSSASLFSRIRTNSTYSNTDSNLSGSHSRPPLELAGRVPSVRGTQRVFLKRSNNVASQAINDDGDSNDRVIKQGV